MEQQELYGITQDPNARPYRVVQRTLTGVSAGFLTRSTFDSKDDYDGWKVGNMDDGRPLSQVYASVAKGVSDEDALKLCENANSLDYLLQRAKRIAERIPDPKLSEKILGFEATNAIMAENSKTPHSN